MDFDVAVETLRALVTILIVLYLWRVGIREQLRAQKGWRLILAGFSLILFATLLDITDNFPSLDHYVVIGKTHTESFLEKMVGYLGGCIVLFIGFTQWIPLVAKLRSAEIELRNKAAELELTVLSRTADLLKKNEELQEETQRLTEAEIQVRQLALYDTLTRLPNRRLLNERIAQSMAASKRSHRYGALLFLDLDNFKLFNDTHGHDVGDLLLIEVAHRLTTCVREVDTAARLGGDEFVVMLSELDEDKGESITQASIIAENICMKLAEPYVLALQQESGARTLEHRCTASIGVTLFIDLDFSVVDILKRADIAMYQAKDGGRNKVQFYE